MAELLAIAGEYELKEELGKGAFSVVYRAIHRASKEEVAIKVISKQQIGQDDKTKRRLETEVAILQKVSHPNIIALKRIIDAPDKLFLVMELVNGGELFDKIVQKGSYSERDACVVVKQIASAIDYLHKNHIAHRDLKPENLLLKGNDDTHVMISDFGLSRIIGEDSLMSTACGTPYYVAPEVVKATAYGKEVDMWSIGVITYFLLAGFPPFMGENLKEIMELIMNADYDFPSPYWDDISEDGKSFVRALLCVDPGARLSPEQALLHPWLASGNASSKPLKNSEAIKKNYNLSKLSKQMSF